MYLSLFSVYYLHEENNYQTCSNVRVQRDLSHRLVREVPEKSAECRCRVICERMLTGDFRAKRILGEQDHIHVFASAHPKIAPSYIAKMLKGISAQKCFKQFPQLKKQLWGGHLWNPSYYIETIGSISEGAIQRYIANQQKGAD